MCERESVRECVCVCVCVFVNVCAPVVGQSRCSVHVQDALTVCVWVNVNVCECLFVCVCV